MKHFNLISDNSQPTGKENLPEVEVLEIVPAENRGNLKAYCTVRIGEFVFNDCRIIRQEGQRAWFTFPQLSYRSQYGTQLYRTLITIRDKRLKDTVSQAVVSAWEKSTKGE